MSDDLLLILLSYFFSIFFNRNLETTAHTHAKTTWNRVAYSS